MKRNEKNYKLFKINNSRFRRSKQLTKTNYSFTKSSNYRFKSKHFMEHLNGLSVRHVAQIVRRKMIQRSKESKKIYKRAKNKKLDRE